ncbi:MAG: hypothetical protein JO079_10150 [Frankiaceae bacterium]|nr:hypothetical protein [Frankiaceae bacterium]MBV9369611.1 hypothetical protein [Frankiales bacterium]
MNAPAITLPDGCEQPFQSIDEVVAGLKAIDGKLPPYDGLGHFNRMYLGVTEGVRDAAQSGLFSDSEFLTRLDVVFANRYLLAVQAASGLPVAAPHCWSTITERRMSSDVAPMQFALAGMTSHICYDLVDSVVRTVEEFGVEPTAVKADFTRVNDILDQLEPTTRSALVSGHELDGKAGEVFDAVGEWGLAAARSAAFADAELLWDLRKHRHVSDDYEHTLDAAVAFANDCLLVPAGELKAAHLAPVHAFWHGRPTGVHGLNRLRHQPPMADTAADRADAVSGTRATR